MAEDNEFYYIKKDAINYYKISKSLADWYVLHGYEVINCSLTYLDGSTIKFHIILEVFKGMVSDQHKRHVADAFIEMIDGIES